MDWTTQSSFPLVYSTRFSTFRFRYIMELLSGQHPLLFTSNTQDSPSHPPTRTRQTTADRQTMVRILPQLVALSAALTYVLAHGPSRIRRSQSLTHDGGSPYAHNSILEKRAPSGPQHPEPTTCTQKTYTTPIAAGAFPALDCIPFIEDPQVQDWLKLVDMTKVPSFPLSNDGACPAAGTTPAAQCWWTCSKCVAPEDVTNCPQPGNWGLTYDGKFCALNFFYSLSGQCATWSS